MSENRKYLPVEMIDRYNRGAGSHDYHATGHCLPSYQRNVLGPFAESVDKQFGSDAYFIDVASGKGEAVDFVKEKHGLRGVKLDISELALALSIGNRLVVNVPDLPLRNGIVQAVHMKDSLVHIYDRDKLFEEFSRILVSGGLVLLATSTLGKVGYIPYYTNENMECCSTFRNIDEYYKEYAALCDLGSEVAIGPPYFPLNESTIARQAKRAGFKLLDRTSWTNPADEPDWYEYPADRLVMTLRKG